MDGEERLLYACTALYTKRVFKRVLQLNSHLLYYALSQRLDVLLDANTVTDKKHHSNTVGWPHSQTVMLVFQGVTKVTCC